MAQAIGLSASNISCHRGGALLFHDLNFALNAGEALLIGGPNGAGKTSLLRLVAGLLPLETGALHLDGAEPDAYLPELCHYVGHANGIKSALSVEENLRFFAAYLGGGNERVEAALDTFGLSPLRRLQAVMLSAGQKRKLALSRLFTAPRPIWLLDEPSVSLDEASAKLLERSIAAHLADGGLALVASHTPFRLKFAHSLALGGKRAR